MTERTVEEIRRYCELRIEVLSDPQRYGLCEECDNFQTVATMQRLITFIGGGPDILGKHVQENIRRRIAYIENESLTRPLHKDAETLIALRNQLKELK